LPLFTLRVGRVRVTLEVFKLLLDSRAIIEQPSKALAVLSGFSKGDLMAGNININVCITGDCVRLKLDGEFDGSSACELLNLLSDEGVSSLLLLLLALFKSA
jgi:hypothetical protein